MEKPRRGRPPIYKDRITALKRGKSVYFAGASQNSLKAIASHLGRFLGRTFTTEGYPDGVWVRREK
jgi:hypothetical protein